MKVKILVLICLLFCSNLFGQIKDDVHLEDVYLAKDDGTGLAGEIAENFYTTDVPIHCIVRLDSFKSAMVKMNFIAVKVNGVKPETKVLSVKYQTNGEQSQVNFTGKPDKYWVAGNYRIDIFIDEKPAKSLAFEIQKSPQDLEKEKLAPIKTKSKVIKKFRKN